MAAVLWVALGGAIGSVARYGVTVGAGRAFGGGFPWGTFAVNVVGSFAIGLAMTLLLRKMPETAEVRFFLITGVLGGFTTFSAFSWDAVQLFERGAYGQAAIYVGGTVLLSLAAVFMGLVLGRGLGA